MSECCPVCALRLSPKEESAVNFRNIRLHNRCLAFYKEKVEADRKRSSLKDDVAALEAQCERLATAGAAEENRRVLAESAVAKLREELDNAREEKREEKLRRIAAEEALLDFRSIFGTLDIPSDFVHPDLKVRLRAASDAVVVRLADTANQALEAFDVSGVERQLRLETVNLMNQLDSIAENWSKIDLARKRFDECSDLQQRILNLEQHDPQLVGERDDCRIQCLEELILSEPQLAEDSAGEVEVADLIERVRVVDTPLADRLCEALSAEKEHRDEMANLRESRHKALVAAKTNLLKSVTSLCCDGDTMGPQLGDVLLPNLANAIREWNQTIPPVRDESALKKLLGEVEGLLRVGAVELSNQRQSMKLLDDMRETQADAAACLGRSQTIVQELKDEYDRVAKLRKREKKATHQLELIALESDSDEDSSSGDRASRMESTTRTLRGIKNEIAASIDTVADLKRKISVWKSEEYFPELRHAFLAAFPDAPYNLDWNLFQVPRQLHDYEVVEEKSQRTLFARIGGRDVVLKRFNVNDSQLSRRISDEMKLRIKVRHRNVLLPTAGFIEGSTLFLEYPRMDGNLKEMPRLGLEDGLTFCHHLWSALAMLHSHAIFCGDIRPETILFQVRQDAEGKDLPPEPMLHGFGRGGGRRFSVEFNPPERMGPSWRVEHDVYQLGKCTHRFFRSTSSGGLTENEEARINESLLSLVDICTRREPMRPKAHHTWMSIVQLLSEARHPLEAQQRLVDYWILHPPGYWVEVTPESWLMEPWLISSFREEIMRDVATRTGSHRQDGRIGNVDLNTSQRLWAMYRSEYTAAERRIEEARGLQQYISTCSEDVNRLDIFELAYSPRLACEFHMYMGTSMERAKIIMRHGIDAFRRKGTCLEEPIIFMRHPRLALERADGALLVVRVVLGIWKEGTPGTEDTYCEVPLPAEDGKEFDSVKFSSVSSSYVVFSKARVYPEFLVELYDPKVKEHHAPRYAFGCPRQPLDSLQEQ